MRNLNVARNCRCHRAIAQFSFRIVHTPVTRPNRSFSKSPRPLTTVRGAARLAGAVGACSMLARPSTVTEAGSTAKMELWEIEARDAIRDLVVRYNSNGDAGRFAEVMELFAADAVMVLDDHVRTGREEILTIFTGVREHLTVTDATGSKAPTYVRHMTATHQIDLIDQHAARGRCYSRLACRLRRRRRSTDRRPRLVHHVRRRPVCSHLGAHLVPRSCLRQPRSARRSGRSDHASRPACLRVQRVQDQRVQDQPVTCTAYASSARRVSSRPAAGSRSTTSVQPMDS